MGKISEYKALLYRKISKRQAFVYKINDKFYAISGERIFEIQSRFNKCHYEIYQKLLVFQQPKDRICDSIARLADVARSECEHDYLPLAPFMTACDLDMVRQFSEAMDQFDLNRRKYCSIA